MFKPTILIDFDDTITAHLGFDYPPNEKAVIGLNKLKNKFKIVIFSCRANKNICPVTDKIFLIDYLEKYKIPYDEISTRKPVFFALIDDRSFNPKSMEWDAIADDLLSQIE